jgi:DNA-damage-inducible protein J
MDGIKMKNGSVPQRQASSFSVTPVANEKTSPFEVLTPNETTLAAMREARAGNLKSFDSVEALMADLHAED